jgi:hypothetical protein
MKIIFLNSFLLIAIIFVKISYSNQTFLKNTHEDQIIKPEINSLSSFYKHGYSSFILSSETNKPAMINFKIKNTSLLFSLGLIDGKLVLNNDKNKNIEIDGEKSMTLKASILTLNSLDVKGPVKFNKVDQWKLINHDSFHKNETSLNWSHDKVTKCNHYNIMGGHCQTSSKELIKEFNNLPPHTQIKIEATYHFFGSWDSHSGYLKVDNLNFKKEDPKYVWTNRCKNSKVKPIIKLCPIEVCKTASPINVTLDHSDKSITLIFGSTLERGSCEQSYGISDVKIYIRSKKSGVYRLSKLSKDLK